jgi:hypothetical protein
MARIQSKSSGRKFIPPRICPLEIKAKTEEALARKGNATKRWGEYKPRTQPAG